MKATKKTETNQYFPLYLLAAMFSLGVVIVFGGHLYDKMTSNPAEVQLVSGYEMVEGEAPEVALFTTVITESRIFEIPAEGWWLSDYKGLCDFYKGEEPDTFKYDFELAEWMSVSDHYSEPNTKAKALKNLTVFTAYDRAEEIHFFRAYKNMYYCEEAQKKTKGPDYNPNNRVRDMIDCTTVKVSN